MAAQVDAILEAREKTHGPFTLHATISQALKDIMQVEEGWSALLPDQREALDMIAHKIARILNGNPNYEDHWADIAGYAELVARRLRHASVS